MGFLTLRRFAPACGCPSVSRPSIARAHDPFGSRSRRCVRRRLPAVRAHVSFIARPRPTVSVGGSIVPIGNSLQGAIDRGFATRLLGFAPVCGPYPPPFVFCSGPILPWVFVVASLRVLRGGLRQSRVVASALATRILSQSVACRAASPCRARTVVPRPGRVRRSSDGLDIRPARPPLKPLRAAHRLCVKECQDQRQAIPMTCFRHRLPVERFERPTRAASRRRLSDELLEPVPV